MAKKENFDLDTDYDFDIGSEDWGDDPFNPSQSSSNDRNPVVKAGSSLLRGAKEETKNPTFYKNMLKAGMPESFSIFSDSVDDTLDITSRTYNQAMREARPMLTQVQRMAKSVNKIVPSPWQAKIDAYLQSKDKKASDSASIDMEEAIVEQGLGDIFTKQEQEDRKEQKAQEIIDHVNTKDYRRNVLTSLQGIQRQLNIQTENQLKVQRAWQHKTLEVQLRQLFIARTTMQITKQGMEENSALLRDVVKNTALPEIQKEQQSETLTRLTRERIYGAAQTKVADWARSNQYMRAVANRFQKSLQQRLRSFQLGLQSGAEMFESVEEQARAAREMGIDTTELAGELAGGSLANRAGGWVGKKLGKTLKLNRADNFFRSLNFRKDMIGHTLSRHGRKMKMGSSRLGQWFGDVLDVPFTQDTTVGQGRLADMSERAGRLDYEDRKLQSLEVTLPGYLSRILQEVNGIRTGRISDRVVFDPQRGTFSTMRQSTRELEQQILSDDTIRQSQSSLRDLIDNVGGKKLSRRHKAELGQFLRDKSRDQRWGFSPEALLEEGNGMSADLRHRLGEVLSTRYGLEHDNATGRWRAPLKGMSGIGELERDARMYGGFRDYASDVYKNVKAVKSMGGLEQLLEMGAVYWNKDTQTYELKDDYIENRSNAEFRRQGWKNREAFKDGRSRSDDSPGFRNDGDGSLGPRPRPGGLSPNAVPEDEKKSGLLSFMGRNKEQNLARVIRDQTEALLDAFDNASNRELQDEANDFLADILDKLNSGIDTNGTGTGPVKAGLFGRALRAGKRGVKGMWNLGGYPFKAANWARKKLQRPFGWVGKKVFGRAKKIGSGIWNTVRGKLTDVYTMGQDGLRRALEKADIELGIFTDVKTGKVIKRLKDITGPVINTRTGEMVITQEDFDKGIFNATGEKIKAGVVNALRSGLGFAGKLLVSPITAPYKMARSGIQAVKRMMLTPPDIYLRGQMDKPVLYGQQMYNGMYWSASTNKIVRYVGDIDGDIYTWDHESKTKRIVLTAQQIQDPGLVDARGQPMIGFMKKWKDRIKSVGGFIGRNINPMTWLRRGKGFTDKIWGSIKGGLSSVSGAVSGVTGGLLPGSWPKRIFTLLWNKFNDLPLDQGLGTPGEAGEGLGSRVKRGAGWVKDKTLAGFAKLASIPGIAPLLAKLDPRQLKALGLGGLKNLFKPTNMKDRLKTVAEREGSWLWKANQKTSQIKDYVKTKAENVKRFPWLATIMSGFGILGGVLLKIKNTFANFGKTLFGWMPKILKGIRDSRLMSGALDLLGGGRKGRVLRKVGRGLKRVGQFLNPFGKKGMVRTAGRALGTGAMAAGRAALSVGGTALRLGVAALASPWGLAALAVVGVGYGIYRGWKAYSGRITSTREMRLAQYGFSKDIDSDKSGKIFALEETCQKVLKYDSDGIPSIGSKLDPNELMSGFEIDPTGAKNVYAWQTWYAKRFMPVFLQNMKVIHAKSKDGDITDAHVNLPKGLLGAYAMESRLPRDGAQGPYYIDASPFPNTNCEIGTQRIDATIGAVVKEFKRDADKLKAKERKALGLANEKNESFTDANGQRIVAGHQKNIKDEDRLYDTNDANKALDTFKGDTDKLRKVTRNKIIGDVTSLRMRMYGMIELSKSHVNVIQRFEEALITKNIVIRDGTAQFEGSFQDIADEWCAGFGMAVTDTKARNDWMTWFTKRFLPVFLNFCSRGNKWLGLNNLLNKCDTAHPEIQLSIAEFMTIATTKLNSRRTTSVWTIASYPFPDESANTDTMIITPIMVSLRSKVREQAYRDKVSQENKKDPSQRRSEEQIRREILLKEYRGNKAAVAGHMAAEQLSKLYGNATGGNSNKGPTGTGSNTGADLGLDTSVNITGGRKGSAGELPYVDPKAIEQAGNISKRLPMLLPLYQAISEMTGVPVETMVAFSSMESGLNPLIKAPDVKGKDGKMIKVTAGGLFQFNDQTWRHWTPMLKEFGFENPDRYDPAANAVAGALYIKQHHTDMQKYLGRAPSIGEIYLGNFLGPGGSKQILKGNPNDDWGQLNPAAKASNPGIYAQAQTVAQLRQWADNHMQKGLKNMGSAAPVAGAKPASLQTNTGPMPDNGDTKNPGMMGNLPVPPKVETPRMDSAEDGSTPAAAEPIGPSKPAPVTNAAATSGTLPRAPSAEATPPKAQPVAPNRNDIKVQQARQMEKEEEVVRQQRTVDATNQARNRQEAARDEVMRTESGVRERIAKATERSAEMLEYIYEKMSGGSGSVASNPVSTNQTKEDMMMKTSRGSIPVGQKSGNLPFDPSH